MARTIVLAPYDANWAKQFQQEREILHGIFGELAADIQHFGSTSVPGLMAKPIIDIMVVVYDIGLVDGLNERMNALGYEARGEHGIAGRRYFVKFTDDGSGNHTHHIHAYQEGHPHISGELLFRDYLRVSAQARKQYQQVKMEAAKRYRHSPQAYTEAKTECVRRLTEEALSRLTGSPGKT